MVSLFFLYRTVFNWSVVKAPASQEPMRGFFSMSKFFYLLECANLKNYWSDLRNSFRFRELIYRVRPQFILPGLRDCSKGLPRPWFIKGLTELTVETPWPLDLATFGCQKKPDLRRWRRCHGVLVRQSSKITTIGSTVGRLFSLQCVERLV